MDINNLIERIKAEYKVKSIKPCHEYIHSSDGTEWTNPTNGEAGFLIDVSSDTSLLVGDLIISHYVADSCYVGGENLSANIDTYLSSTQIYDYMVASGGHFERDYGSGVQHWWTIKEKEICFNRLEVSFSSEYHHNYINFIGYIIELDLS